jgi:hypothetical protein
MYLACPWFCMDLQLGRVNVLPRPIPDIHLCSNWNPSWRLLPHALITVQTPYLKYHPVLPCHSQTRTQTFPTRPQGSLLLPHHHRFSPYPPPHIPTATSYSDVPLAGATIPDAMSLHLVPPVRSAYEASCARHRWFRIARRHCEDLRALLPEMAVLYCYLSFDIM